jgi:hypothetical protein
VPVEQVQPGREVEEADAASADGLSILDLVDAVCSHYHEHLREVLTQWSWKLFCRRFARMLRQVRREEDQREAARRNANNR